jgi:hypothetical protein
MTIYYQFIPSKSNAPSFMPTFDGQQYNVSIVWNISAQRFYVKCMTLQGALVFLVPLVNSNPPIEITSFVWDEFNARVVATTAKSHGMPIGQVININIINTVPSAFNGSGLGFVLSDNQIVYPMQQNPGQATMLGVLDMFISMTKAYFQSTLVFRNMVFEVTP